MVNQPAERPPGHVLCQHPLAYLLGLKRSYVMQVLGGLFTRHPEGFESEDC